MTLLLHGDVEACCPLHSGRRRSELEPHTMASWRSHHRRPRVWRSRNSSSRCFGIHSISLSTPAGFWTGASPCVHFHGTVYVALSIPPPGGGPFLENKTVDWSKSLKTQLSDTARNRWRLSLNFTRLGRGRPAALVEGLLQVNCLGDMWARPSCTRIF